jgi:hypothetical protein
MSNNSGQGATRAASTYPFSPFVSKNMTMKDHEGSHSYRS